LKRFPKNAHRLFVQTIPDVGSQLEIDAISCRVLRVLRLQDGDEIHLINGRGQYAKAVLTQTKKQSYVARIEHRQTQDFERPRIHLVQGLLKADKADWIVQKTTELGVSSISFVCTRYAVSMKKPKIVERWTKIAQEACRQSGCLYLPNIQYYTSLDFLWEALPKRSYNIICDESATETGLPELLGQISESNTVDLVLAVGPEGGWHEKEILQFHEKSFKSSMLHANILRAETAAVVSVAVATMIVLK